MFQVTIRRDGQYIHHSCSGIEYFKNTLLLFLSNGRTIFVQTPFIAFVKTEKSNVN